jgi:Flp pilus assembly protein protease CpaA
VKVIFRDLRSVTLLIANRYSFFFFFFFLFLIFIASRYFSCLELTQWILFGVFLLSFLRHFLGSESEDWGLLFLFFSEWLD